MAGNTVTLEISLNSSDATKGIEAFASKAKKGFSGVQSAIVTMNQGLELAGKAFRGLGSIFDSTVTKAIKLEKNVAEITTLLGDNAGAASKLTDEILNLQKQYGTSSADLASAYYQAISSGAVDASTANELMVSASKLAIGGITNMETAVDGLTTIMKAFGKTSSDSKKISDALFIGMKAGKTTVGELSSNIGKAASIANTMNVDFTELIATISAITTGGVSTAEAVTQVNGAMVALARQTPNLTGVLNNLGITNVQTAIKTDGLVGVLKKIVSTTDGTVASMTPLFGSIEAVKSVVALTSDTIGGTFNKIMLDMGNIAKNEGAVTQEAFQKMADTTDQKLKVLGATIEVYLTKLGIYFKAIIGPFIGKLIPLIDEMANSFIEVTDGVISTYNALSKIDFKNLETTIKASALAVTAFGAAWLALNTGLIVSSIGTLTTALGVYAISAWNAAAATASAAAPYIAIVAAITGVVVAVDLLIANWKKLGNVATETLKYIGNSITEYALKGLNLLLSGILNVSKGMNNLGIVSDEAISKIVEAQDKLNASIDETILKQDENSKALENTLDKAEFSGGSIAKIISEMSDVMDLFGKDTDKATSKIVSQLGAVNNVKDAISDPAIISASIDKSKSATTTIKDDSKGLSSTNPYVQDIYKTSASILSNAGSAIADGLSSLTSTLSSGADATRQGLDKVKELSTSITEQTKKIEDYRNAAAKASTEEERTALELKLKEEEANLKKLNDEKEKAEKGMQKSAEDAGIKTVAGAVGGIVGIFNKGAGQFISQIIELLKDPEALTAFIQNLIDAIPLVIDAVVEALPDVITAIIDALPTIIEKIIDALPFIIETLAENLPRLIVILAKGVWQLIMKLPAIFIALFRGLFKGISEEFGKAFADIGAKFGAKFTEIFDKFKEFNKKLIEIPNNFARKIGEAATKFLSKIGESATTFISNLVTGAVEFISKLVEEIKGALPKIGGSKGTQIGGTAGQITEGIKGAFGFADGGYVPQGFPNDTYPAALTSGELVLNKDQQNSLGLASNEMLGEILSAVRSPIRISTDVKLHESTFANIILQLNKDNRRLA